MRESGFEFGIPDVLAEVAGIEVLEAQLSHLAYSPEIAQAIREAQLGINPGTDSDVVRLPIPALTQDRRKELTKVVKRIGEDARVAVRNCRRDARELLDVAGKDGEITEDDVEQGHKKVQLVIDKSIAKIDDIIEKKQAEIMEV